jgi:hypothetical protein
LLVEYLIILWYLSLSIGKYLLQYLAESIVRIYVDGSNKIIRNIIHSKKLFQKIFSAVAGPLEAVRQLTRRVF